MNTAACVCHGEEVSADFERREGGTEGNRGRSCQAIGPRAHTQNVQKPPRVMREAQMKTPNWEQLGAEFWWRSTEPDQNPIPQPESAL